MSFFWHSSPRRLFAKSRSIRRYEILLVLMSFQSINESYRNIGRSPMAWIPPRFEFEICYQPHQRIWETKTINRKLIAKRIRGKWIELVSSLKASALALFGNITGNGRIIPNNFIWGHLWDSEVGSVSIEGKLRLNARRRKRVASSPTAEPHTRRSLSHCSGGMSQDSFNWMVLLSEHF